MRQPNHTPILRLAALLGLLVLLTLWVLPGHADFGDFSGDSDFGDSDWDWDWDDGNNSGSDWSWSSNWSSSSDRDDWYDGYDGSDRDNRAESNGKPDPILIILFVIFLLFRIFLEPVSDFISEKTDAKERRRETQRAQYSELFTSAFYHSIHIFSDWRFHPKPISTLPVERPDGAWLQNLYAQIEQAWVEGNDSIPRNDCAPEYLTQYSDDLQAKNATRSTVSYRIITVEYDFAGWNEDGNDYVIAVRASVHVHAWTENRLGQFVSRLIKRKENANFNRLLHYGQDISLPYCCVFRRSKNTPAASSEGKGWLLASMESMDLPSFHSVQWFGGFVRWGFRLKSMDNFPVNTPNPV